MGRAIRVGPELRLRWFLDDVRESWRRQCGMWQLYLDRQRTWSR